MYYNHCLNIQQINICFLYGLLMTMVALNSYVYDQKLHLAGFPMDSGKFQCFEQNNF